MNIDELEFIKEQCIDNIEIFNEYLDCLNIKRKELIANYNHKYRQRITLQKINREIKKIKSSINSKLIFLNITEKKLEIEEKSTELKEMFSNILNQEEHREENFKKSFEGLSFFDEDRESVDSINENFEKEFSEEALIHFINKQKEKRKEWFIKEED